MKAPDESASRAERRNFFKTALALFTGALTIKAGRAEAQARNTIAGVDPQTKSVYDGTVGEILMFTGTFAPVDWMFCNGQTLQITQYESLYAVIGNIYGGDGITNFKVPDLRGRVPIHVSNNHVLGEFGGAETVELTPDHLPSHSHTAINSVTVRCSSNIGTSASPVGCVPARSAADVPQYAAGSNATMASNAVSVQTIVGNAGGSGAAHDNMMPYLVINYIICFRGYFPARP